MHPQTTSWMVCEADVRTRSGEAEESGADWYVRGRPPRFYGEKPKQEEDDYPQEPPQFCPHVVIGFSKD